MITTRPAPTRRRALALLALPAVTAAALGACSADDSPSLTATTSGPGSEPSAVGTLVDVRTPGEYAAGHLDGAINIDSSAGDFTEQLEALDKHAAYTVYCRSGNRSARAVETMTELGFTDVHDAGGMEEASQALGVPVVTE